ncbi:hypothetical protein CRE_21374 [Caenorhabditis remanei]|uniref:SPK domain-containing protein n=1 Tax=Caenorhabditis remanei TaxID=31234 RepID=E3MUM0_CAERE|nr:hypothetical protein CRE_21374 [Caenorhabditis remanei]
MEYYNKNLYGINWSEYLKMFPGKGKSKLVSRKMEVTMLQRLLDQGIVNKEPVVLNAFWQCLVEEEKWGGIWERYREHFRQSVAHRIQHLKFMDSKYRALMLYVSSRRVTDTFKKELAKDECVCQYDEYDRIISIVSKDKQVDVGGKTLSKVPARYNWKTQKDNEKDDKENENKEEDNEEEDEDDEKEYQDDDDDEKKDDDKKEDEEDEKEEDDVKEDGDEKNNFKKGSSKHEKDNETKEEGLSQSNPVMTIERFYDNLKTLIQTHCRKNKLEYSFMWGLEQESKDKEMSNFEMIKLLEKLACWVTECPDEETDVIKIDKFQLLMMFNAMVGMIPGYENMKEKIESALNLECERDQKVPLALLGQMIVSILDEFSTY